MMAYPNHLDINQDMLHGLTNAINQLNVRTRGGSETKLWQTFSVLPHCMYYAKQPPT